MSRLRKTIIPALVTVIAGVVVYSNSFSVPFRTVEKALELARAEKDEQLVHVLQAHLKAFKRREALRTGD